MKTMITQGLMLFALTTPCWASSNIVESAAIDKHIAQTCLAYDGIEMANSRQVFKTEVDGETNRPEIVVVFCVEYISGGNYYYQFVSVLKDFSWDANGIRPIFFQKIGARGVRHFDKIEQTTRGVVLLGHESGPRDPMSTLSVPCKLLLRTVDSVIKLEKDDKKSNTPSDRTR